MICFFFSCQCYKPHTTAVKLHIYGPLTQMVGLEHKCAAEEYLNCAQMVIITANVTV